VRNYLKRQDCNEKTNGYKNKDQKIGLRAKLFCQPQMSGKNEPEILRGGEESLWMEQTTEGSQRQPRSPKMN